MLGASALDEGKLDEGIARWKHILDIRRQIHSPDHPKIAQQLENLGEAYYLEMHDYQEALRYFTESLAIYRTNYGDQHKNVIQLEEKIGKIYEETGDLTRALECYQYVLKLQKQRLPHGHLDLSKLIDTIAKTYKKNGDNKRAMLFIEQEKASQISVLGKNHPCIASTLMTIGDVLDNNETYQYYQEALSLLEKSSPQDEMRAIACIEMLGGLELDDNKVADGLAHLMQALDIRRRIQPADHNDVAHLLHSFGDVHFDCIQDYSEALRYYLESLAIYQAKYLPQHSSVIEVEGKIQKVRRKMAKT
jgi:tetratricopeptide (TPR) repeat protein